MEKDWLYLSERKRLLSGGPLIALNWYAIRRMPACTVVEGSHRRRDPHGGD